MSTLKVYNGSAWEQLVGASQNMLVAEQVVSGSAVTSLQFLNLDGDAHGGYTIHFSLKNASGASATNIAIYANNLQTATDYYRQIDSAIDTVFSGARANESLVTTANASSETFAVIEVNSTPSRVFSSLSNIAFAATTSLRYYKLVTVKTVALAANLTQLDFVASVASSLAIGTKVSVYRRK